MTPLGAQLVQLYAQHLEHGPEQTDEYLALRGTGEPSTEFLETWYPIATRRDAAWRQRARPRHEQVRHALLSVRKAPNERQRELVFEFMRTAYKDVWTDAQRAFYESLGRLFVSGYDYFLSFTGRGTGSNETVLRANREFKGFIADTLLSSVVEQSHLGTQNLLAHALNARLKEREPAGFFYPEKIGNWERVKDKLEKACRLSLNLIQLVDNEMLRERESVTDENYCHREYSWALEASASILFVLPYATRDHLLSADDVAPGLEAWYEAVSSADVPLLAPAREGSTTALTNIDNTIELLLERVRETRLNRLSEIPV